MAILNGGYNGDSPQDDVPDDTGPYEPTEGEMKYIELGHGDRTLPKVDQIHAAIADYQLDRTGTLPALDPNTITNPEIEDN